MTDKLHQFTHSNTKRRASVVYGSVGKGGLYNGTDFVLEYRNTDIDNGADEDDQLGEQSPLLVPPLHAANRRKLTVESELLNLEQEFLRENQIFVDDASISDAFENAVAARKVHTTASIEFKLLIKSSIPLVATFLLQNSLSTVSVFSVGHLGATELAAVSMGSMTANITGYATIQGIATALDTLCPQAFGARKYKLVGVYLQKCTTLIFVIMLPILIMWVFFGYRIIILVLPDKDTAHLAAVYLQYITPGIPGYILFECGKRFLQAQGIYHILTYVLLFAAPSNLLMNIAFVRHFGYLGAPIAVAINYWLMALGLLFCTLYVVKKEDAPLGMHPLTCWGGLTMRDCFSSWKRLVVLAVPGLIMLEAEFLAFEILTLMASYLGTLELAAQSVGSTVATVTYQVPFAIGIASSTRIANFLGAGLGDAAKKSTQVALTFGLFVSVFNFFLLYTFSLQIAALFTGDERVIDLINSVMWLIALMQIFDATNANSAGCLRGQGQTKIGGIVNIISYYVVGIPLLIYLSFYSPWKGSLDGLWIGTTVALAIIGFVQSYVSLFSDFEKLCDDARKRTSVSV